MLIYIHGFNSSASSFKAALLRTRMERLGRSAELAYPDLPHRPLQAIALLERLIVNAGPERCALIGSSLGGFYATWLAERYGVRAVVVNPAVRPYELLKDALGTQTNLYTGTRYEFTEAHLEELRSLEVGSVIPRHYLLIVRTGDEVLDYRDAVAKYRGSEQIVEEGGDHGFGDFDRYVDRALAFCGVSVA
jgi:uncharacterized protein